MQAVMISATEFVRRAGVTYRQFDHWSRHGVLGSPDVPGSGNHRMVDEALVPAVRLLGRLQDWASGAALYPIRGGRGPGVHRSVLAEIVAHYDDGQHTIAPGVTLTWTVEDQ